MRARQRQPAAETRTSRRATLSGNTWTAEVAAKDPRPGTPPAPDRGSPPAGGSSGKPAVTCRADRRRTAGSRRRILRASRARGDGDSTARSDDTAIGRNGDRSRSVQHRGAIVAARPAIAGSSPFDAHPLRRLGSLALPITVPSRHIPLSAVRDAANSIYGAAVRTPLVRVDLRPRRSAVGDLPQARSCCSRSARSRFAAPTTSSGSCRPSSCATASGPSAPATPRRASRSPRARSARPAR